MWSFENNLLLGYRENHRSSKNHDAYNAWCEEQDRNPKKRSNMRMWRSLTGIAKRGSREWLKRADCKSVVRWFESNLHLLQV